MIDLRCHALGAVVMVAMLVGCDGGSNTRFSPSPAGVTAERTRPDVRYSVLYSFKDGSGDGEYPQASLSNVNGSLYGTTYYGGADGRGAVFSITPSGTETVFHSFKGGSGDGENPYAGLINVNGKLYGTTFGGGANGHGTVFAISTSGKETVLHGFGRSGDGSNPVAGLMNLKGTLYGTTYAGGANSGGTVFAITTIESARPTTARYSVIKRCAAYVFRLISLSCEDAIL
ncbi:MAG: choice-of-anchor tandem repeat GloVer-containing protein [Candidatus Cybelea sp.]